MEIVKRHLVFIWKQNGPDSYQEMEEVLETQERLFFYKEGNGIVQITKEKFDSSEKDTLEKLGI